MRLPKRRGYLLKRRCGAYMQLRLACGSRLGSRISSWQSVVRTNDNSRRDHDGEVSGLWALTPPPPPERAVEGGGVIPERDQMSEELGALVAKEREAAKLTQKQVAERLGVHQTGISRVENGQTTPDLGFHEVLEAIGTDSARRLSEIIRVQWQHLSQPSYRHPNLEDLVAIEAALSKLYAFKEKDDVTNILAGQANLLFRRLIDAANFLLQLDHRINYVGEIGVGKTTAVCRQAELVIDPSRPNDLRGMMLDTGGGRTTLCDVIVQKGERYSFAVDPLPDEEVYRLAGELCRSVFDKGAIAASQQTSVDFRPAEEVVRALRNMAGLARQPTRFRNQNVPDPLVELANSANSMESFEASFASKLTLWRRTRREIEFDGVDDFSGRRWFRETFIDLNNGKNSDFSLPAKIIATVPFPPMADTTFNVTIMDTRGIDGSSIRPDIVARIKDQRAVTVLCTKWGSAPDTALQTLIKHVIDTEIDPLFVDRIAILVLARAGDALSMRYESGEGAQDISEGYDLKLGHVEDALKREQLPSVATFAFDSAQDEGLELTKFLSERIDELRAAHLIAAKKTMTAIEQMLGNVKEAQALAAFAGINKELQVFATRNEVLQGAPKSIYPRLLASINRSHPRTLWAATRRNGSYWNFDFYQHLGDGAADEIRRRSANVMHGLREIVKNKFFSSEYETARGFLQQLLEDMTAWESDLVEAARHFAGAVYEPKLRAAALLWRECESFYGRGLPYRERVANKIEGWFDEHRALEEDLNSNFQLAWQQSIIEPIRRAAGEAGLL